MKFREFKIHVKVKVKVKDTEPTNFLAIPAKFQLAQQNFLLIQQKSLLGELIFLGKQKKFVGSMSTIRFANPVNLFSPCRSIHLSL